MKIRAKDRTRERIEAHILKMSPIVFSMLWQTDRAWSLIWSDLLRDFFQPVCHSPIKAPRFIYNGWVQIILKFDMIFKTEQQITLKLNMLLWPAIIFGNRFECIAAIKQQKLQMKCMGGQFTTFLNSLNGRIKRLSLEYRNYTARTEYTTRVK